MPLFRLRREVPRSELLRWMAFYQLDPWGDQRADYRTAQVCIAVLRAAGVKRKLTLSDFMDFRFESPSADAPADPNVHPVEALLTRVGLEAKAADGRKPRKSNPRTRR